MSHQSASNAGTLRKSETFVVLGGLDLMPGVYRAVDAVVPQLSWSIHTANESSQSDERVRSNGLRRGRHS